MSYPCDRFAAALAHCLNSESQPVVRIEPGALYVSLVDLLAARYAGPLLHHPLYAARMTAEEAASRYFDATLGRRLTLSGRVQLSIAHRLFAALCQRGSAALWRESTLAREAGPANDAPLPALPGLIGPVSQRLARLSDETSPGSASPTLLSRHGPVTLRLGAQRARVPEEISAWDGIQCAPSDLIALEQGEAFNRFCSVVIDCVRTANRPVQEVLGLGRGLCPFDWLDTLSIQQVRSLRRFLAVLEEAGAADTPQSWAQAFTDAPVPGFKSAQLLWESEIGFAMRNASGRRAVALDEAPALGEDEDEEEFLPQAEFARQLEWLQDDGVIHAAERELLMALYRGAELSDVTRKPALAQLLRERDMDMEALQADLQRRVTKWQRQSEGGAHGFQ